MCCRCIHLLREKHVCVWLGKKKSIKALFGHFKLYCISLNAFLSFLNKSFFSRVLLVKIRDWCMKNVHTFFLSNAENPVVMIQWKWTSALQNYLEKKKGKQVKKCLWLKCFCFLFLLFTDSNLKLSGAQKHVHILNVAFALIFYCLTVNSMLSECCFVKNWFLSGSWLEDGFIWIL